MQPDRYMARRAHLVYVIAYVVNEPFERHGSDGVDNLIDLEKRNWGLVLIDRLLYPLALLATPSFLLALMVYFVVGAFAESLGSGVRSFSSVLLPLMLLAFLVAFKKNEL